MAFEFRPELSAQVRAPTSLDANLRNLDSFTYGGVTNPVGKVGLPEVVTRSPPARAVTRQPQAIA